MWCAPGRIEPRKLCIAAVIFEPIPFSYLQSMDEDNPHGGGVAWEQDNKIYFVKGLNAKQIHDMQESGMMTYPYLLHFRWATHGDHVAALTHPFPLGPRALMGELTGTADKVLIHNGTWNYYDTRAMAFMNNGNHELPEELVGSGSDTAIAAWLAAYGEELLDSVPWATALAEMRETTNEAGELVKTMDITTRGTWYDKDNNWYSNLNWVPNEKFNYYNFYNDPSNSRWEDTDASKSTWDPDVYEATDPYWKSVVKGYGWKSCITGVPPEARKDDTAYIGRCNDICVNQRWYDHWFPEKDHYRPDNVDAADWYERFDWTKTAAIDKELANAKEKTALDRDDEQGRAEKAISNPVKAGEGPESWNDYLVAKYGPRVAAEINACFPNEEPSEGEESSDSETDETVLEGFRRDYRDPDWLHDGDLITDNPSQVNAWLAKQMIRDAS